MRTCISIMLVSVVAAGLCGLAAFGWDWNRLELEFELRSGWQFYAMQERNFCTVTQDVVAVLFDHPTLDRLRARAYTARALSFENIGLELFEGVDDLNTAIKLDPKYARAYAYRGCTFSPIAYGNLRPPLSVSERADYRKQMISDLKTAIALDPHGLPTELAYYLLYSEYECQLNHQSAIEICDLAISNLPKSELRALRGHYMSRSLAYGKLRQREKELEDFRAAKKLDAELEQTDLCDGFVWHSKKPAILAFMTTFALFMRRRNLTLAV